MAPIIEAESTLTDRYQSQSEALAIEVEGLQRKDPDWYGRRNATTRLAAIERLAFHVIPADPSRPEYRQGHMRGSAHAHWCRAKVFQQYRIFFRYHAASRVIVCAWVNDEDSRRAYESQHDAYRTLRKMLDRGHSPDGWDALLAESHGIPPRRRCLCG